MWGGEMKRSLTQPDRLADVLGYAVFTRDGDICAGTLATVGNDTTGRNIKHTKERSQDRACKLYNDETTWSELFNVGYRCKRVDIWEVDDV